MLRNDTGQVEEGHRYLALAVRLDANNFEGLMGLSRSYFLRNELRRAMVWANIAVQRGPKEPDARSLRGMIHSRLGEWDQARADFASCVRDQPWGGSAYLRLAQAELQLGNRPGAISALERAQRKASKRRDIDALVNALRRGESPSFPEML
jgi:tetratricopeptide (TPR) repeat protein